VLEVRTSAQTSLTPDQVIAAAADFSSAREKLWPNSKDKYLRVHDSGADFAEVTEGFRLIGVFWERSRYDWSQPGTIRQAVIDSNVIEPRLSWELTATPTADGTDVVMRLSREFKPTVKGRVGWALNKFAGTWLWRSYLRRALTEAEKRSIRHERGA
jgi:hypothetical protein